MALLEGYNLDQLNRLLGASKWILAATSLAFVSAGLFHQWLAGRISTLQHREAEQEIKASQTELKQANAKTAELTAALARYTAPRRLTDEQITALRSCLEDGPHGKVVMASLKVESDADTYAQQIGQLLTDCGFEVTTSKTVWLQLAVKGLYLCARDASSAPAHAVHIQRCFQSSGLRLRAHEDKKMYADMNVPEDAIIFVVSGRE